MLRGPDEIALRLQHQHRPWWTVWWGRSRWPGYRRLVERWEYRRRPYQGRADLRSMQLLTQRLWAQGGRRWHMGELAWFRYQHSGREPEWPTSLWEYGEELVGWSWARVPGQLDPHLDLHLDPAHPQLAGHVLRWFADVADHRHRTITVLDAETDLRDALSRHGYREVDGEPFFVHLGRSLDHLPEPEVPAGYTLRPVRDESDADARAAVHRAAFSTHRHASRVTAESYLQVMRTWPYREELDWLVAAPDGTPVAFCLVWLDEHNRVAALEPVGTDPDHRRRGLARAAMLGALHAARRLGAASACVSPRGDDDDPSARATYQSLGFRRFARNVTFERS
jgi:ribosomal protein S18 acetylase RimI-like enzyme